MMTKQAKLTILFALTFLLLPLACDSDNNNIIEKEMLTISEAQNCFKNAVIEYEKQKDINNIKNNSLTPNNFTPRWDIAVESENSNIWSLDIPIISDTKYWIVNQKQTEQWAATATQKIVIIKNKETKKCNLFLLTLIPDKDCAIKFKRKSLAKVYIHIGNSSEFSGMVIYSSIFGEINKIVKYNNGYIDDNQYTIDMQNRETSFFNEKKIFKSISKELTLSTQSYEWGLDEWGLDETYCYMCGQVLNGNGLCGNCWIFESCDLCGSPITECTCYNTCQICGHSFFDCTCNGYNPPDDDPTSCRYCHRSECSGECQREPGKGTVCPFCGCSTQTANGCCCK
ncbi:MAG: hypothetical protein LBJ63_10940 [Prevotellaceae bacterium]|jgi:hypothetical protein|nr:hypothetical protein [Prevotellaceae bacterium]